MRASRKLGAILKEVKTIDFPKVLANPIASILSNISIYAKVAFVVLFDGGLLRFGLLTMKLAEQFLTHEVFNGKYVYLARQVEEFVAYSVV